MPARPDLPEPGAAADWLRYARSDLALARVEPPAGVLTEMLCFHAQQAAEKALKALLIPVLKNDCAYYRSHPRPDRGSSLQALYWIPASAGMTLHNHFEEPVLRGSNDR
ncbi:HEPN domain-containing protein [Rhodocaloribacter sp.]